MVKIKKYHLIYLIVVCSPALKHSGNGYIMSEQIFRIRNLSAAVVADIVLR